MSTVRNPEILRTSVFGQKFGQLHDQLVEAIGAESTPAPGQLRELIWAMAVNPDAMELFTTLAASERAEHERDMGR